MTLTVLSVAYPFAPVGPDACGGAEQVLHHLDKALLAAGHRSLVIASKASRIEGEHIAVPDFTGAIDETARAAAHRHLRETLIETLARHAVDLVHMHGVDFQAYLPPPGMPVLATLHLPAGWYAAEALRPVRPGTWFNCVSRSQHESFAPNPHLLPPIENGAPVESIMPPHAKRRFALLLSRICPEKGIHIAIDAAKRADMPLLIGGEVFPYEAHRRYFDEEVRPRLDHARRFLGPVGLRRKRRLLAAAQCVLIPSLVAETSSLVAREALAAGTPVVAFARGALVETIEHGRTGFLVEDADGMASAMTASAALDGELCRSAARTRFSLDRMTSAYLAVYERLARTGVSRRLLGAA